jgi:hypothetical protein
MAQPGADLTSFNPYALFESSTNMPPGNWQSGLQTFPLSLEGTIYAPSANPYYSPGAFAKGFASGLGIPGISAPVSFAGPNASQDYGFGLGQMAGGGFAMAIPWGQIRWLGGATGLGEELPYQLHHFASNKSAAYTAQFEEIAGKYGLGLDEPWNTELLPHLGRHPDLYHDFVLQGMMEADEAAEGDVMTFMQEFETRVKAPVRENPGMLRSAWWE